MSKNKILILSANSLIVAGIITAHNSIRIAKHPNRMDAIVEANKKPIDILYLTDDIPIEKQFNQRAQEISTNNFI